MTDDFRLTYVTGYIDDKDRWAICYHYGEIPLDIQAVACHVVYVGLAQPTEE